MTRRAISRFYKTVGIAALEGGFGVLLDGKPVKTPGRSMLVLPNLALAEAVAEEWRVQEAAVDPTRMPLTGLAHAAIDLVPRHRGQVTEHILGFGRSDLLCYRAEGPAELVQRQAMAWDPLLQWAADALGATLQTGQGIAFMSQPLATGLALKRLVGALGDFHLAALDRATSLTGSLVLGLALLECRLDAAQAFAAATVDEVYQAEKWGSDPEAEGRRRIMRSELEATERFLKYLAVPQA